MSDLHPPMTELIWSGPNGDVAGYYECCGPGKDDHSILIGETPPRKRQMVKTADLRKPDEAPAPKSVKK